MEQCSSELTAKYKSSLANGNSFIDLSGGFGVDTYFISQSFEKGFHCEIDAELQFIAQHNFEALTANIQSINTDGIEYLQHANSTFDLFYIDPSRRNASNQKLVQLKEYTPNVLEHLDLLLEKSKTILLKTAPLLDITQVLQQIKSVKEIHIVAVNNECKELLFLIDKNFQSEVEIQCTDLTKHISFRFKQNDERTKCAYSFPKTYIYEPNVSILKAGAFNTIAQRYNLKKLQLNSHLYTSDILVEEFPGRTFELKRVTTLNKKEIIPHISGKKANITRRNFPLTVEEIRQKTGLKEGGDDYLFATTLMDEEKRILICKKI